jgi:autotransporter-associated beta strand protein
MQIGVGNSAAFATIGTGAIVTNTGTFTISDNTNAASSGDRRAQFLVRGGTVVSTGVNGIIIANQSDTNAAVTVAGSNIGGVLDVNSGSLTVQQITLIRDSTITNAYARLNLSGSGIIYLGSGGLVANVGVSKTAFNIAPSGGTFAATADWSSSAPMAITGTVTFQAADASSTPHNITLSGVLSSTGSLNKIGNGILTLNTNDTYSGPTLVNAGTLAIGASGSISNTPAIVVGSGTTLDATAVPSGLPINSAKTLQGLGTVLGTVNVASGGIINPGSNAVTGTLTLGTLVENGGATYNYFTNSGPNPDFLVLTGDLDVTNVNTIQINGEVAGNTVYPLIQYGGNFNGGLANFSVIGATGSLSNNASTKTIYLVTANPLREPTNVVWVGNAANNVWDTTTSSNWLNSGTGKPDFFVPGDSARFDSTGATNPLVNIPGSVTPGSVTADTASNYTFYGIGNIGGTGGLTKTNSGTLTVMTTNSYTGQTIVSGGVFAVTNLGISGSPSSIGAASPDPTNLMLTDSILRYIGTNNASSDRGAALGDIGATIDMPASGVTLTLSGVINGQSLTKTGPGTLSLTGIDTYTNVTVQNGTLALGASGGGFGVISNQNGTTLRINSAVTVSNAFDAEGTVVVDLNNVSGNTSMNGAWSGSGTVLVTNQQQGSNRLFTIGGNGFGGGNMTNFFGTIELGTFSGTCRFNDGGGSVNTGSSNMIFDLGTSTAVFVSRNGGATINFGALMGGPNTIISGHTSGTGNVTYSIGGKGLSTEFDGNFQDSTNPVGAVVLTLVGGALRLTGATNTYTGGTAINAGTLQVDGQITATGSTISVNGGELTGDGIIGGSVSVGFGATFVPGDGLGVLAVSNSLTLGAGSTNIFELNATLGTNSAVVGLVGVLYGGNLIVTNVAGTLTAGQTFTLISSAGFFGGSWDSVTLPPLDSGLHWDTNSLAVNGSITVRGALKITSVTNSAGNIIIGGINGSPSGTYYVLSSTNVAVPFTNWIPLSTNMFNPDGSFNATNPIVPGVPRDFYILQDVGP